MQYPKQLWLRCGAALLSLALAAIFLRTFPGTAAALFAPGIVPNGDPGQGFDIEGDLRANTPTANTTDWLPGNAGTGVGVLTAAGAPVDAAKTFHLTDLYDSQADNIFRGGLKYPDNPNTWTWTTSKATAKLDMNHGLLHVSNDANGHLWVTVASDRLSTSGNSYMDFEFLQKTLTANANGTFTSAGTNAGRTVGDLLLTLELTSGGTQPNFFVQRWEADGSVPIGFTYHTITPPPGTTFSGSNVTGMTPVSFNAFGAANYQQYAFAEAALDVTALIQNLNPCLGISTVMMKTKSSQAPTADLGDFIAPIQLALGTTPTANAGPDISDCPFQQGPVDFDLTGTATNGTPAWSVVNNPGNLMVNIANANTLTPTVTLAGTGTVTVRLTVTSQSCGTATDDVVLAVTAGATANAGPDLTLCQAASGPTVFTVAGMVSSGGDTEWSVQSTTGTAMATIDSPFTETTAVNVTGTGTVTLKLDTNTETCGRASDTVVLIVNPTPAANAGFDQSQCQANPQPTVFNLSGTASNGSPQWSVVSMTGNATAMIMNANMLTPTVSVTGAGTVTLNLVVTSPNCGTATDDIVLTVNPSPSTVITAPMTVTPNSTGNMASVPNDVMGASYFWSITNGTITNGQNTPTITFTAGASGTVTLSVQGSTSLECTSSGQKTINIACPAISLTPSTLPNPVIGVFYSQQLGATGGTGPYTFTHTSGTLPTGLTLTSGGLLSGTPAVVNNFSFTITANDTRNCPGMLTYMVTVACPAITVTPPTLPNPQAGVFYAQTLTASGGTSPYSFMLMGGALPQGLSLSTGGVLSGTPTQTGPFSFTVKATDFLGCTGMLQYTGTVGCPTITVAQPPPGVAGQFYSYQLTATPAGGNYTFMVTSGTLPAGLTLTPGGLLSGTVPTAGSFNFTITATGFGGQCSNNGQMLTLVIGCPNITLRSGPLTSGWVNLPGGITNAFYSQSVAASPAGGNYSYALTYNILPPGLTLNSATGVISGIPSAGGSYTFIVTATGFGNCTGAQAYNLLITTNCTPITFSPTALPGGTLGTAYNQTVTAMGGDAPYTYIVLSGALPDGLTLNAATGALSGTPLRSGLFAFTLRATGVGGCTGTQQYLINIACVTPVITTAALPDGTVGVRYAQTLTASPAGNYTFSLLLGSLPPNFSLSSGGALSGTPGTTGTYNFTVKAQTGSCQTTKSYRLVIGTTPVGGSPASAQQQ